MTTSTTTIIERALTIEKAIKKRSKEIKSLKFYFYKVERAITIWGGNREKSNMLSNK